jgi:hypothetical protein
MFTQIRTSVAVALVSVLLAQAPSAFAQETQENINWRGVSALKPGDRIFLGTSKAKVFGPLKEVTANSISLTTGKGVQTFAQQEVRQVRYVSPRQMTYRKVATGMMVGVAGLAGLNLALGIKGAKDLRSGKDNVVIGVGLLPMLGAMGGALALIIKGKGKKVYQAE